MAFERQFDQTTIRNVFMLFFVTVFLLMLASCLIGSGHRARALTTEELESIDIGMTEKEVDRILGSQGAEYSIPGNKDQGYLKYWREHTPRVLVGFDKDGKVTYKALSKDNPETFWQKMRRWLHM
ncbi:MAG: hypothetical protein HY040_09310 [Planctomycetes bacterium]|nr:hypothetical protein [Planctomycetota bacterium]